MRKRKPDKTKSSDKPRLELDLLENALDFISRSLDPILNQKSVIDVKYSVLHLHAGVELIFKEILYREHWSLIIQNIDKAEKASLETGSFHSINSEIAIDRLAKVCGVHISPKAKQNFKSLRDKRNIIEHYAFKADEPALKSIVSEVLVEVLDLIDEQIEVPQKGFASKDLKAIREKALAFKEYTEKKMVKLEPQLQALGKDCEIITCPNCLQNAFLLNDDFNCLFCKYSDRPEKVIHLYVENVLKYRKNYHEDGIMDYYPVEECPECESETLLARDNDYICFTCFTRWDTSSLYRCDRCSRLFVCMSEDDGTICGKCFSDIVDSAD